ncbi:MAG: transglutaminase-like domain-containing protein, partial [Planctomycetota bacterium]
SLLMPIIGCWILIPARSGMLRWAAALLLLFLLMRHDHSLSLVLGTALLALVLQLDSWFRQQLLPTPGLVINRHRRSHPSQVLLPTLLVLLAGSPLLLIDSPSQARGTRTGGGGASTEPIPGPLPLNLRMDLNDPLWTSQSTAPVALLLTGDGPPLEGPRYLRSLALPELRLDGEHLQWHGAANASLPLPDRVPLHAGPDNRPLRLVRLRGGNDAVLRPAGAAWLELPGCIGDADGNCFQPGLGLTTTLYAVDAGGPHYPASTAAALRAKPMPRSLRRRVQQALPELIAGLSQQTPRAAATQLILHLQQQCRYSLNGPVDGGTVAGLLRFLTGSSEQRRGHCQYFASAAVVLLRTAGFAARPVIGYLSDEQHDHGFLFRSIHAHAWVEILNVDGQWLRLDPTPGVALQMDAAELDRDPRLLMEDWEGEALRHIERGPNWSLLAGIGILVVATVVMLLRYRRRAPNSSAGISGHLLRASEDLLDQAVALGIEVNPGSSITDIVRAIEGKTGRDLDDALQAYHRARFAGDRQAFSGWPPL